MTSRKMYGLGIQSPSRPPPQPGKLVRGITVHSVSGKQKLKEFSSTMAERKVKGSGHSEVVRVKMDRAEPIPSGSRLVPLRTHFRLNTIEGVLLAGIYSIHVVPSSKSQSRQQYLINQNIEGILNLNQDYLFPYGTRLQIGLFRGVDDEQEALRVKGSSPERYLSSQVSLKADRFCKSRHSVKFEDQSGLVVGINMEWWTFNNKENAVVEASLVWVGGKAKIKYDSE